MEKTNSQNDLKKFLDQKVMQFNNPSFIKDDPVSIPHLFSLKQDIEIAGFLLQYFPGEPGKPSSTNANLFCN